MSYTTTAIREARRQCREERMRQGLDRHLVNEDEVRSRAALVEALWTNRAETERWAAIQDYARQAAGRGINELKAQVVARIDNAGCL